MKRFELPRTPAQWLEAVMNAIFFLCGILAVGCVAVITIYMFLSGLPAIGKIGPLNFLFGTEWASTASEPKYGILPFLLSSIYGTLGASLIGVPVGLLTAVFLSKAAAPGVRNVVSDMEVRGLEIPRKDYGEYIRKGREAGVIDTALSLIHI